jgi:hypothetical protein
MIKNQDINNRKIGISGKLPGTQDDSLAPKTPSVKGSISGLDKGFAPKTPTVKESNGGTKNK